MRYSRSHRRHHLERLKRKRYLESLRSATTDPTWAIRNANARVHTACICSCFVCGNPRSFYGNSKQGLTMQELRQLE